MRTIKPFFARKHTSSLLTKLVVVASLCWSSMALAQGKVTKQGGCKVQVDGLANASLGMAVTIKAGVKSYSGKITVAKPPRALVQIEGETTCPSLVGKPVTATGTQEAGVTASPNPSTSDSKKTMFGLSVSGGYGLLTWKKQVFDQTSLSYQGSDLNASAMFLLNISNTASIPFLAGVSRFSNKVELQNSSKQSWTYTASSLLARGGAGIRYALAPSLIASTILFFDYGVSSKLVVTGDSDAGTYPLAGVMRYGGQAGMEFLFSPHFGIGLDGSFYVGSMRVNSTKLVVVPNSTSADVASHPIMGFAGFGRASVYF